MANTSSSIQGMFDALQFDLDRLRAMFGYSAGTGQAQASVGTVRTRRSTKSRRRTSARSQSTQTQPQVVGQTQQAKPHRRVSAGTRKKLQAAARARWAARKGQQQAA